MSRSNQANEFNTFVGGLVTEASPLTFPGNAALDINNYKLSKTGTISRRLGMDYETSSVSIDSGVAVGVDGEVAVTTHNWDNVGGNSSLKFIVVQTGNVVKFFNTSGTSISGSLVHTHTYPTSEVNTPYSMSVVDGLLVVATGTKQLSSFSYENEVISESTYILKVRDSFGVGYVANNVDYRDSSNLTKRPHVNPGGSPHVYNLRNSTYSQLRVAANSENIEDPIKTFIDLDSLTPIYPSNSDSLVSALYADPNDSDDRVTERFFPETLIKSPVGNFESPKGYFIIDALERGTSRLSEAANLVSNVSEYKYFVDSLPLDRTPGGATVVGEFSGRVWYSGFSGVVEGGDKFSPKMSSYILFSQLVSTSSDLGKCYQDGDPTSKTSPDLVDTDGGFIRLDDAYNILKFINIGSALIVIAENGVWSIQGGNNFGFTALDYKVSKITDHGCVNVNSPVLVDSSVVYWGDDGIYQITTNELGDLTSVNMTNSTIQKLYEEISDLDKANVQGEFDSYERTIRWVYGNRLGEGSSVKELILDVNLSAFYKNSINSVNSQFPKLVSPVEVPPFKIGSVTSGVVHDGDAVVNGVDTITNTSNIRVNGLRELVYVTVTSTSPTVEYTFSKYSDRDFVDWKSFDSIGLDSPAYILTGYNGGGDFQRNKQIPYITFHFERTEDGFTTDALGDLYPTHESSCKVQAQWEWSNSPASGRWGREFQAYRYKRFYMPEDASDDYDTGFSVVSTKNKLRGKGKVLSLLIQTEPLKDCKLLGWSTITSVANNV